MTTRTVQSNRPRRSNSFVVAAVTAAFSSLFSTRFRLMAVLIALWLTLPAWHCAQAQTLLLRYTFDESDNTNDPAEDSGAEPHAQGIFEGGAWRIGDTPGDFSIGALDVTWDNASYVSAGDIDKVDALESLTLTAWINLRSDPIHGNRVMAKQKPTDPFEGFSFAYHGGGFGQPVPAGAAQLNLAVSGATGWSLRVSEGTVDAELKWAFVAVTYDGAGNVVFYSGGEDAEASVAQMGGTINFFGAENPGPLASNDEEFRVAFAGSGFTSPPAWMDDVRVYDGVLTLEQLDAVRLENLGEGTIQPPAGVEILNPERIGDTVTFEFESEADRTYRVEYKNDLNDPSWQVLETIPGTGSTVTVTDPTATVGTRFYQVVTL